MKSAAILLISVSCLAGAPMPAIRPHPRLQIDQALIQQIRALRDQSDPAWTRLARFTKSNADVRAVNALYSSMLVFLVDGNQAELQKAWKVVRTKIYRNGTDHQAGLTPLLQIYHGDAHQAAFQGGVFVASIAHFYDWGYARLSPADRKDVADWLYDSAAYTFLDNKSSRAFLRNDGASATYGLAAAAYALLGDDPRAEKMLEWFRTYWAEVVKGLDVMGKGGAAGEGNAYGTAPTASGLISTANAVYYASGEDLFLSHSWFRLRLGYDAFADYPSPIGGKEAPVQWPIRRIVEQASVGGDGRRAASWHSQHLRPNGLMLARHFAGTDEATAWNWVNRQPAVDHVQEDNQAFFDLLYYSPRPKSVKPARLSWYDPSEGYVYLRSDWDSPDATWIAFWAGPHIDTHQHLDQGAFTIFKRRDLAPKTGHYDNDNVKSPHHLAWYSRTVSSNGILVGDPHEVFRGFIAGMGCDVNGKGDRISTPDHREQVCIPNDGGQRTMFPRGMAVRDAASFYNERDIWETARVVSFHDEAGAVSVVADITNAYSNPRHSAPPNKPKVNRVWRRLVYLREPDILLVADTVESTDPIFQKKWLLHSLDRLEVGGTVQKIDDGESIHTDVDEAKIVVDDADRSDRYQTTFDLRRGYAALLVKTLFPAKFRYRVVGGRNAADTPDADLYGFGKSADHFHRHLKDFYVRDFSEGVLPGHKSANWAPGFANEAFAKEYLPVYGPGYGRWRLELEPTTSAKTDYFLNVLKPTLDSREKLPAITRLETEKTYGAEIRIGNRKFQVLFPKDTLDAPVIGWQRE